MPDAPTFFVLRAPLLSADLLRQWQACVTATPATPAPALAETLAADRARLRAIYRRLLDDPVVREAIFVASPDLDRAVDHWRTAPDSDRGLAAERALTRYLTRMASRPTPFGLFGSTAVGGIGDTTSLSIAPVSGCRRHTRLDMDYLASLVEHLGQRRDIRAHLRYRPNSSLYRAAGRWRFVETRLRDAARSHHLVSLTADEALDETLARASSGASIATLAAALVGPGIPHDDAEAYVHELVDGQVLEPDLACPVTGDEPHGCLVARLAALPPAADVARVLADCEARIVAIDAQPLGVAPDAYLEVARALEPLGVPVRLSRLFQADLARPAEATLGPDALAVLQRGVELLHRLQVPHEPELDRLRLAWSDRYEGREVPLAEALDADLGLGAALVAGDRGSSALLDGLDFPAAPRESIEWGARERHLLDLVGRAVQQGVDEIVLTEADLAALATPRPRPLPEAYAVMATLMRRPGDRLQAIVHMVSGPSGARLLGRFCHGDAALAAHVRQHLRAEEAHDPDAIYAEIAHLPEGRLGNILLRPVLRDHEIAYLGVSGAEADRQFALDDLTVQLTGDRFVLRSRRLGRRVVPRLSSAHHFSRHAVGLYRFLCLLQGQGTTEAAWSWGPLQALPHLPRVRVGDVVLDRARWRLTKADIRAIDVRDATARYAAVQRWRAGRRLPRWVVLADYDNALPIDLENVLAVDSFVALVRERDEAELTEHYPAPDALLAQGPEGAYAHEVVVPFVRQASAVTAPPARRPSPARVTRVFPPGSPWVFAKLYGGSGAADRVLREVVAPVSRRLLAQGSVARWFFIRYRDPDEHVRWRLEAARGVSPSRARTAVERAMQSLLDTGLVRRVTFDTYEREIERYGGSPAIALAEQWFWADSECTVDVLDALDATTGDDRWRAGVLGVDRLLDELGLSLAEKASVMCEVREAFGHEFHVDADFRRALAGKLRPHERALEALLVSGPEAGTSLAAVEAALTRRRRRARGAMTRLRWLEAQGRLDATRASLAPSYVHMTLNRLFRSEQRMHELVLYDFLAQIYQRRRRRDEATTR